MGYSYNSTSISSQFGESGSPYSSEGESHLPQFQHSQLSTSREVTAVMTAKPQVSHIITSPSALPSTSSSQAVSAYSPLFEIPPLYRNSDPNSPTTAEPSPIPRSRTVTADIAPSHLKRVH